MSEAVIEFFRSIIHNDAAVVIIIAILPIVELRGAIPVAMAMNMSPFISFLLAFIGSSIVVPFLLLLLQWILNLLKKIKWFKTLALAIEVMFQTKAEKIQKNQMEKKGITDPKKVGDNIKALGVFLFVAIPIPFTGVWTGSAVASFLNIKFSKALLSVLAGNFVAGLLITLITTIFADYVDVIIGIFAVLIVFALIFFIIKLIKYVRIVKNNEIQLTNEGIIIESQKIDKN